MKHRAAYVGPTILLTTIQTMISWAVFMPPVLAKQALPEMGLDPSWIGAQPSIVFLAAMFASTLTGSLVGRVNPMRATQALALMCAAGSGLIATGSLALGVLGSALIGAGLGPTTPASSHILARVTPRHLQPLIFSIKQTGVPVGGALAGFAGPPLMVLWDWQTAMQVVAGACLASVLVAEVWVRGYARHAEPDRRLTLEIIGPVRIFLTNVPLRWMMAGALPLLVAQYAITTFIVLYLQDDIGLSVVAAGAVLAVAQASGGAGRIAFGAVAARLMTPLATLLMLAGLAAAGAFATAAFTASWPLAAIYAVGVGFGASAIGWNGVYIAEVARQAPPGEVSRTTGAVGFVIFAGVMSGPIAISAIVAVSDFRTAFVCVGLLLLTSLAAFVRARTLVRRAAGGGA